MSEPSTVILVAINGVVALLSVLVGAIVTHWTTARSSRLALIKKVHADALAAISVVEGLDREATERSNDGRAYRAAAIQARIAATHAAVFEQKLAAVMAKSDETLWWDHEVTPEAIKILTAALAK